MATIRFVCMLLLFGWMTVSQAMSALAADSRLQILNFSMDRCEPCKAMQPVLAKLIMEGWQIRQIDIGQEPQMVAQFKLQSAPTLVVLAGGRELDRVVGTIAYNKLLAKLEAASRAAQQPTGATTSSTLPPASAPQLSAQRDGSPAQLSMEPPIVRGQSPGPADVPDLDVDQDRMLEFVKDLPAAPKFAASNNTSLNNTVSNNNVSNNTAQPSNVQLASSSFNNSRDPSTVVPAHASSQPQFNPQSLGTQPSSSQPQYDPVARAQQATVRIRIEDASSIAFGTGTVMYVHNGQALVLTCGHLFRDLGKDAQMSVDVFDKAGRITNVPAQVVSHSTEEGDIGLMEFRCPYPIVPVPIAKRAPAMGDPAFSFGCDRGADPTRRDTQVKRINRYLGPANIEIHGAPVVGRSGGGLFNAQGQLIGVCNAADAEDDEGIYAALPVIEQHVAVLRLESLPVDAPSSGQGPIQLASTTTSASTNNNFNSSSNSGTAPGVQMAQATVQSPSQVRCVIRDPQGKETALLIDRPSPELVAMLKQAAGK